MMTSPNENISGSHVNRNGMQPDAKPSHAMKDRLNLQFPASIPPVQPPVSNEPPPDVAIKFSAPLPLPPLEQKGLVSAPPLPLEVDSTVSKSSQGQGRSPSPAKEPAPGQVTPPTPPCLPEPSKTMTPKAASGGRDLPPSPGMAKDSVKAPAALSSEAPPSSLDAVKPVASPAKEPIKQNLPAPAKEPIKQSLPAPSSTVVLEPRIPPPLSKPHATPGAEKSAPSKGETSKAILNLPSSEEAREDSSKVTTRDSIPLSPELSSAVPPPVSRPIQPVALKSQYVPQVNLYRTPIIGGKPLKPPPSGHNRVSTDNQQAVKEEFANIDTASLKLKKENVVKKLKARDLSSAVARPPLLLPSRRKAQWDYLLDEVKWMATDFHEERKWKKAMAVVRSAEISNMWKKKLAPSEAARQASEVISRNVTKFWQTMRNEEVYYLGSSVQLSKATIRMEELDKREAETIDITRLNNVLKDRKAKAEESLKEATEAMEVDEGWLLSHQSVAVRWFSALALHQSGAILSDEAGLGNTVTALAYLSRVAQRAHLPGTEGAQLLIVPSWSVMRWRCELQLHAKHLKVQVFESWCFPKQYGRRRPGGSCDGPENIVLCSSSILGRSEAQLLLEHEWSNLVVDAREGEAIQCEPSEWVKMSRLALRIISTRRLLLIDEFVPKTVENLASWLSYILPSVFRSTELVMYWAREFGAGSNKGEGFDLRERLLRGVGPFWLKRKMDVGKNLPDLREVSLIKCPLPPLQKEEYRRIMESGLIRKEDEAKDSALRIFAFRYACLHADLSVWFQHSPINGRQASNPFQPPPNLKCILPPSLTSPMKSSHQASTSPPVHSAIPEDFSSFSNFNMFSCHNSLEHGQASSGKFLTILKLLQQLKPSHSKVLLLASAPIALELIHTYLAAAEVPHECAFPNPDTDVAQAWYRCQTAVHLFNSNPSISVLIAHTSSTLAKGGLTPSAADVVMIVDDDWSKLGREELKKVLVRLRVRKKKLSIYRLVAEGTIEEALWGEAQGMDKIHGGYLGRVLYMDGGEKKFGSADLMAVERLEGPYVLVIMYVLKLTFSYCSPA